MGVHRYGAEAGGRDRHWVTCSINQLWCKVVNALGCARVCVCVGGVSCCSGLRSPWPRTALVCTHGGLLTGVCARHACSWCSWLARARADNTHVHSRDPLQTGRHSGLSMHTYTGARHRIACIAPCCGPLSHPCPVFQPGISTFSFFPPQLQAMLAAASSAASSPSLGILPKDKHDGALQVSVSRGGSSWTRNRTRGRESKCALMSRH